MATTSSDGLARLQRLAQAAESLPVTAPAPRAPARKLPDRLSIHPQRSAWRLKTSHILACIGILVLILLALRNSLKTTYVMHHTPWMDQALHSVEDSVHVVQDGVHSVQKSLEGRRFGVQISKNKASRLPGR
mmetsp:Transcript_16152/g.44995  ORF Transcript_16152/g.44995 Transcript_16152/m.44995 type:complete len:132 (+) Transcript_16152:267-662(+)